MKPSPRRNHWRPRSSQSAGVVALSLVLVLSACTSNAPQDPVSYDSLIERAREIGSAAQVEALEDGVVSREELQSVYWDYGECLTAEGLTLEDLGVNPVDGWRPLYNVWWPGKTDDAGWKLSETCYDNTMRYASFGFEMTHIDQMNPSFVADVLKCLSGVGVETTGEEQNLRELAPLGEDDPRLARVLDCVNLVGESYPSGILVTY